KESFFLCLFTIIFVRIQNYKCIVIFEKIIKPKIRGAQIKECSLKKWHSSTGSKATTGILYLCLQG
ncbi:hypothetical protein, partial [Bacillus thuringiensis]|uniref:hypothetical protein n=1 Tax=Bacillus thuringiensis TaxID=1428 RepID=UPI001C54FF59